jgi:hypothetical protein
MRPASPVGSGTMRRMSARGYGTPSAIPIYRGGSTRTTRAMPWRNIRTEQPAGLEQPAGSGRRNQPTHLRPAYGHPRPRTLAKAEGALTSPRRWWGIGTGRRSAMIVGETEDDADWSDGDMKWSASQPANEPPHVYRIWDLWICTAVFIFLFDFSTMIK